MLQALLQRDQDLVLDARRVCWPHATGRRPRSAIRDAESALHLAERPRHHQPDEQREQRRPARGSERRSPTPLGTRRRASASIPGPHRRRDDEGEEHQRDDEPQLPQRQRQDDDAEQDEPPHGRSPGGVAESASRPLCQHHRRSEVRATAGAPRVSSRCARVQAAAPRHLPASRRRGATTRARSRLPPNGWTTHGSQSDRRASASAEQRQHHGHEKNDEQELGDEDSPPPTASKSKSNIRNQIISNLQGQSRCPPPAACERRQPIVPALTGSQT